MSTIGAPNTDVADTAASTSTFSIDISKFFPADNPVFSGGFSLAVLAAGAQLLRMGSTSMLALLKKNCLVTLEVTSKDRAYPWVLQWLTSQGNRTQHLSVETMMKAAGPNRSNLSFSFVPGPGQHFITYRGRFLAVQRIREQQMVDLNTGKPWEKVQFIGLGRNTQTFEEILHDAYELASSKEEGKTIIYTNWGSEWRQFGHPRSRRPLESVILDEGVAESLLQDVTEWRCSAQWYLSRGIPYRRGYLLHGQPGSGKTSFILALAGRIGYNVCVLNLAERGMTDDRLALALSTSPPQCIILLEDIDAAFPKRSKHNNAASHMSSEVTFSGLLNTLDGAVSSEERLIFMTTNHIDHLDPALIRPGRVDVVQMIGNATQYQIREMVKKFYPESTETQIADIMERIQALKTKEFSMAQLQGFFLRFKNSYDEAISSLHFLEQPSVAVETSQSSISSDSNEVAAREFAKKRAQRGPLSIAEIDRMVFNPQSGWDDKL